ncbi:MAG TPA: LysR family transcriptional regulator [Xanthobacteraceae bacterium]|nr:LysR family transcriptional regulator [Xanthobacteraceae bacterium]
MINLPLRQVATFVCLAETQSFRRAAERLRLSQPAVSAHIRELERQVGVALVHRTTRHVSLTIEGKAFAVRARRALEELTLASEDLRELAAVHRGRVVVACIVPMMASVIPRVVQRLNQLHPGLEIEIWDVLSGQLDQLIARGEADLAIGPRPTGANLSFMHLERDYFVAAVPVGHSLAGRGTITFRELTDHPLILTPRHTNGRRVLDRAIDQIHLTLRPQFELVHHFSVGKMVEAGLGVTMLPRSAVPSLASTSIVTVEIKSPRIYRDLGVITRREYQFSPAAQAFVTVLKTCFAPADRDDETPKEPKVARRRRMADVIAS